MHFRGMVKLVSGESVPEDVSDKMWPTADPWRAGSSLRIGDRDGATSMHAIKAVEM
eukprot:CAMPEP_0177389818 /NCGR_PEP_ID=MMETSP0368-20130122/52797_1 /TAXON_ID=447022 ORGANISM="Scrippsiella hangoei-like, Strain SHHI-4" /NCGR_SAMPLE_ID=MMETSP0368 /ASSEMBLY_ACC=CAM_ASM_000363 /LENGTH=55 /DNA_ID=CAMNT_0018855313 /DNA_START=41 /DNA_END=205 /DNA_ORIENTATION=+